MEGLRRRRGAGSAVRRCHLCRCNLSIPDVPLMPNLPPIIRDLARQFEGRILAFDDQAAAIWGEIVGAGERLGRPQPALDTQIAAIARRHNLVLATRNTRDFEDMDVRLTNPWRPARAGDSAAGLGRLASDPDR